MTMLSQCLSACSAPTYVNVNSHSKLCSHTWVQGAMSALVHARRRAAMGRA